LRIKWAAGGIEAWEGSHNSGGPPCNEGCMDVTNNLAMPSKAVSAVNTVAQGGGALALGESGVATRGDAARTDATPQDMVSISAAARTIRSGQVSATEGARETRSDQLLRQAGNGRLEFRAQSPSTPQPLETSSQTETREFQTTQRLTSEDRSVQANRSATFLAAGSLGSAPDFVYKRAPDGRRYAVDGHVAINTGDGDNPSETLIRARKIRSAAVSSTGDTNRDIQLASHAQVMASRAYRRLDSMRAAERTSLNEAIDARLPGNKPSEEILGPREQAPESVNDKPAMQSSLPSEFSIDKISQLVTLRTQGPADLDTSQTLEQKQMTMDSNLFARELAVPPMDVQMATASPSEKMDERVNETSFGLVQDTATGDGGKIGQMEALGLQNQEQKDIFAAEETAFDPFRSDGPLVGQQQATDMQLLELRLEKENADQQEYKKFNVDRRLEEYRDDSARELQGGQAKENNSEIVFS
jgi:hypothetical protein